MNIKLQSNIFNSKVCVVPGDKSISQRAIILASIAEGVSTIDNFLFAGDPISTLKALSKLGVKYTITTENLLLIEGVGLYGLKASDGTLDLGNSGTGMRLMAGLLAGQSFNSVLTGDESLSIRPMQRVVTPLEIMGANISSNNGCAPLTIKRRKGLLKAINYKLPVDSAQLESCLLLAALYADGASKIISKQSLRNHTLNLFNVFNLNYKVESLDSVYKEISINPTEKLTSAKIKIPGDISSAVFLIVACLISKNSKLKLLDVGINSTRTGAIDVLKLMGARINFENVREMNGEKVADILVASSSLVGVNIPTEYVLRVIDEIPIILIAASCAMGKTTVKGAKELRYKESDRITAMSKGLSTLGITVKEFSDGIEVEGGTLLGGCVDSYSDHRIAMSFVIASFAAKEDIIIKDCKNILTSFPSFLTEVKKLGACFVEEEDLIEV